MNKWIAAVAMLLMIAVAVWPATLCAYENTGVEIASRFKGKSWADKVNAAVAALPASGGSVDARGLCARRSLSTADTNVILGSDKKSVHLTLGPCTYPLGTHSMLYFSDTEIGGEGTKTRITFKGSGAALRYGGSRQTIGVYRVYFHDFAVSGDDARGSIGVDMTYALLSTLERLNIGRVDNGWRFGGTGTCACYNQIIEVSAGGTSRAGWLDKTANQNQIFGGRAWGAIGLDIDGAASNQIYSLDFEGRGIKNAIVFERNTYSPNGNIVVNPYIEAAGPILLEKGANENSIIGAGGLFERGSIIDHSGNATNYFHDTGGGGGTHGIWPYYQAVQKGLIFGGDPFENSNAELSTPGAYGASQLKWTTRGPSNQYGVFGHAPLEVGEAIARSGARITGLTTTSKLPTPGRPTVTPRGATATTEYKYYVVCHDRNGGVTLPSPAGSTSKGDSTLSRSNYNEITWKPLDGCWSWDVLKGDRDTALLIAGRVPLNRGETEYAFKDIGQATHAYRYPQRNTTGDMRVSGMSISSGIKWPLPITVVNGASFYCPNCDPPKNPPAACSSVGTRSGSWVHGLDNQWLCVP